MPTTIDTATTRAARAHARGQATLTADMPTVPASDWATPPDGVAAQQLTWAETVPGGRYATKVLARGTRLRLRDLTGSACAQVFLWRADKPSERLNSADTVKVPWQAYLGVGHPLLSDQGRLLATVVADTARRHDALTGASTIGHNTAKYGAGQPESESPAGRELLALAAAKHGLTRLDVGAPVSFFFGVTVDADGTLRANGNVGTPADVELVAHVPLIVAVANANHPLDPSPEYRVGGLEILAWHTGAEIDALRTSLPGTDPEYQRAFANTEDDWAATHPASATNR
ncbi:DUF1989 domain-containing protein [Gordonia sp. TBRC 11910]|uniref:DUF1989 domain-containing protein n=1 Tax=Gordonia asplenii TaxID=2725283 RepID=A0A848KNN3_9ACTN|nr:urea amidolyase associated protein UAAP1 [Gordonia asplenii]NMO00296.1 DUF1989 domain-containing protein [Gordonia asplenii]